MAYTKINVGDIYQVNIAAVPFGTFETCGSWGQTLSQSAKFVILEEAREARVSMVFNTYHIALIEESGEIKDENLYAAQMPIESYCRLIGKDDASKDLIEMYAASNKKRRRDALADKIDKLKEELALAQKQLNELDGNKADNKPYSLLEID